MYSRPVRVIRSVVFVASVVGAAVVAGCAPIPYWPPAVSSIGQIEQLPETQRDIRGIDIGNTEVQRIAERFEKLEYVYLNSNSQITDASVISLSKLDHLHQIVIVNGSGISDSGMAVLASMSPLRQLIIYNGVSLTDASLDAFAGKENLRLLYLIDCPQLTSKAKRRIRKELPNCKIRFE